MMTPTTTRRFAAIDQHSGYVWGAADAATITHAAEITLNDADGSRVWTATECHRLDADESLHLYAVAPDLAIDDGQDPATIRAVEASRYVGSVRTATTM